MTVASWPDHLLTLREWDDLPEDTGHHVELVQGVLLVSPRPATFHQRAVTRLCAVLDQQLPDRLSALAEVDVIVEEQPLTVRAPDVVVVGSEVANANPARYTPQDVWLVAEVLSEGSVRTDRVTKFAEYAEVGTPRYWLVDLAQPTTVTMFDLVGGEYELSGEVTGTVAVDCDGTPITIDLDALTAPRGQRI